ncbi:glycosyltransferase family 2 protein [Methylicorpusculum oleiharenae]|uniref:glycosyltransferase family 2 protein n=1 Tax=Methylicorpusculum oleiharenae TaxID=1338687 RepID=UPI001356AD8A|nr:glycosyltransferase family 2 protein [Methylicorpusculum oleiharenae]MCD2450817.1 glycosyltransferase family 2 protein [Methylicorpusculum oleiharenae]
MINNQYTNSEVPRLAIVLPCHNESESIDHAVTQLTSLIQELADEGLISKDSYLFFVDDGSTDNSWVMIDELNQGNKAIKGLKLSQNFGHQAALLAGLTEVTQNCDAAISIDADMQQDPLAIRDFVRELRKGFDVVLGVRKDRNSDGWLKRQTALGFYNLMRIMGVDIVPNHADYRLLSKRALEALALFPEPSIFLRATCLQLGFRVSTVFFDVSERRYGQTKYSLSKMLRLALHGITSFSVVPLRMVAILGFVIFLSSLGMGGYVIWHKLFVGDTIPGWASITLPIYFIGGVQLLCLGVVGEYVGQIYKTVKKRPRWISEYKLD